jgi:hypothetical protein
MPCGGGTNTLSQGQLAPVVGWGQRKRDARLNALEGSVKECRI